MNRDLFLAILSLLAPRLAGVPIAQSLITVMLASAMAASVDERNMPMVPIITDCGGHCAANDNEAHEYNGSVAA